MASKSSTKKKKNDDSLFNRNMAEESIKYFNIALTGIRNNEVIIGTHGGAKDTQMRVILENDRVYPPNKEYVMNINHFDDLWKIFTQKLGNIEFFARITPEERGKWIIENAESGEKYLSDVKDMNVEIVNIGTADFVKKLDEETIEYLVSGDPSSNDDSENIWNIKDVEGLFPAKPGSKGLKGRHTLVMRPSLWSIVIAYQRVSKFEGLILDVENGRILNKYTVDKNESILLFDGIAKKHTEKTTKTTKTSIGNKKKTTTYEKDSVQKVGVLISNDRVLLKEDTIFPIVLDIFPNYTLDDILNVKKSMYKFTAGAYKSLLQKIIRFRAEKIEMYYYTGEENLPEYYNSDFVLVVCCALLLINPGSFVPDIQRFVSGLESITKRLVVTALEDSYLENEEIETLAFSCMISAFLAQRSKEWKPSYSLIQKYFILAITLFNETRCYDYDIEKGLNLEPFTLNSKNSVLQNISALLDDIRSFSGDIGMTRFIANKPKYKKDIKVFQFQSIPIYHCIDQHWAPEIVYFMDYDTVKKYSQKGSEPFALLFRNLFKKVTGINPRKEALDNKFFDNDFVKKVQEAQLLTLISKQNEDIVSKEDITGSICFNYEIDKSWIAGMLGAIEISGKQTALVMLNPNNIDELVAIKRPSREDKKTGAVLTEQRNIEVIELTKKLLEEGVKLNKIKAPIKKLENAELFRFEVFIDDEGNVVEDTDSLSEEEIDNLQTGVKYYIKKKDNTFEDWNDLRMINREINTIEQLDELPSITESLILSLIKSFCIRENCETLLENLITETDDNVMRRVLKYLSGFKSEFEMNRISRDGGATKQTVILEDIGVFHFLLKLSVIYPLAIRRKVQSSIKFEINYPPLLWSLKDIFQCLYSGGQSKSYKWGDIDDSDYRAPWEHQIDALNDMISNHEKGRKAHFLWLPVRMGKTFIVLSYLKYLKENDQLPKYIIYTCPPETVTSVFTEISKFGFDVNICVPVKSRKDIALPDNTVHYCKPDQYKVTIIQHDHLRLCEDDLLNFAPDSVFIVDEVHKALNETKRTNTALSIASLAMDVIALTGTPIIDTHTYKLAWWLEQIVPFEVNPKNFWVAAAGMVAKKVATGVIVNREEILAEFDDDEFDQYAKFVPPALGGTNSKATIQDFNKAIKFCYDVASREMLNQIVDFLQNDIGVLVVTKDLAHQDYMFNLIVENTDIKNKDIFLMKKDKSIYLTDETVESGDTHAFKIVITTIRLAQGYTVNHLKGLVTSVYPSNQATREQIEGRIMKYTDNVYHVFIRVVHCGILTYILQKHNDSATLSAVLSALAKDINVSDLS